MLGTSSIVAALAKKMAKPETETVTRTVAVPKTKIVKQQPHQQTTPHEQTSHLLIHNHRYQINETIEKNVKNQTKSLRLVAV